MISAWASTIIAVLGTLSAGALTGLFNHLIRKSERADVRLRTQQDAAVTAVSELKKAIDRHRAEMWTAVNLRHAGQETVETLIDTHETRSAISEPLTRVLLLVPSLAPAAKAAVSATYDIRDSKTEEDLPALRVAALAAADLLVTTAADQFAEMGVGLTLPEGKTPRKALTSERQ